MKALSRKELEWVGEKSNRSWRARKRKEVRELEKAAWKFLLAAAYTPANAMRILNLVTEAKEKLSVKEWGR